MVKTINLHTLADAAVTYLGPIGLAALAHKAATGKLDGKAVVAEAVTRFTGSMPFVYLHVAITVAWVLVNQGLVPGVPRFDQNYIILATCASVEGIFLSTFVLISQNRAAVAANRRAELDLQVNLLSEHEVTRLLTLTAAIAEKLGVAEARDPSLPELTEHVAPEKVLDRIEEDADEAEA